VEQHGSFRAAAETLHVSQPALTRSVSRAEGQLGVKLFERNHLGAWPTSSGRVLAAVARTVLGLILEIAPRRPQRLASDADLLDYSFVRQVTDHELHALVALAATGTARRAGEILGISRAAATRSLATLKSRLGRDYYDPSHRLRPWVSVAAMTAKRALAEMAAAEQTLHDGLKRRPHQVCLRIGALPASRIYPVPETVQRYTRIAGPVHIAIVDGSYETLLSKLYAGEIDLIIGSLRRNNTPQWLRPERLFDDRLVIVGRSRHPLFRHKRAPQPLTWERWILPASLTPIRNEFDALIERNIVAPPTHVIEVDSFAAARTLLLADDWLAALSASQTIPDERQGRLKRFSPRTGLDTREVCVMTRKTPRRDPHVVAFLKVLRAVAEEPL
jgi:DNA-binding transcriptional LysR family regulator